MNRKKLRIALVGKDVSNSKSESVHTFILNAFGVDVDYESISVPVGDFDCVIHHLLGDFDGFNVTIPYKREVLEYLGGVEGDALSFGAVNTVVCSTGVGYNTDGLGFMQSLKIAGVDVKGKSVLVLGGGGAGRSAAAALKRAGAAVSVYRRNREELEELAEQLGVTAADDPERGGYDILVNATGVGMHDSVGRSPVGKKAFDGAKVAVDMIYQPAVSEFLRLANELGLKSVNGAGMLFLQAYYADCCFLGRQSSDKEAEELYEKYCLQEKEL